MFDLNPRIFEVRKEVARHVEQLRQEGKIGRSEEACVTIRLSGRGEQLYGLVNGRLVRMVCKLGQVFYSECVDSDVFSVEVVEAKSIRDDPEYVLCPRCRQYYGIWSTPPNYDNLCDRCCSVLVQAFPDHPSVPLIVSTLRGQQAEKIAQLQRAAP